MEVVTILVFLVAVLVVLLLLVIFAPRPEVRKEYVIEAPYPNYYAFWPSPYYYGWTSGGSSAALQPWRPRPFHGRRTTYGYGSGYSTGGGHHGGSGHGHGGRGGH